MELKQLHYFVRVVELGSMGRAALELNVTTSTLSQQISRLESELSTRLLQRLSTGVVPTGAGIEFWQHAQAVLRQVKIASSAAQAGRLSGKVSVGMAPTTALMLALPLLRAMQQRYPKIHLHIVEGLSGHLTALLDSRRLDLTMRFDMGEDHRMSVTPLLKEYLFVIGMNNLSGMPKGKSTRLEHLGKLPLILPSGRHTLVSIIMNAFKRKNIMPNVVAEIDGLNTLIGAVQAGMGATIHPSSATSFIHNENIVLIPIADKSLHRCSILTSQPDEELSPAALATRVVLKDVAHGLIKNGLWEGASILGPER
ncbi:LysR substrate-binding domain-containing protein [Paralcaligenes sp. KSB-10]|uniref:LysR substrate-binding domain-containing protein n=1 Tax=Paralcaligenes sp. KSB-10 TaxID=2901142 RepID=UPI001E2E5C07|nr:LysR substrate-binding domain-containing protein [Paralcaligenes sp. KSB-10]UHL64670.1 LysR substrate-binding domain-containing protein [Paralcaligenes sp. KSB-10]